MAEAKNGEFFLDLEYIKPNWNLVREIYPDLVTAVNMCATPEFFAQMSAQYVQYAQNIKRRYKSLNLPADGDPTVIMRIFDDKSGLPRARIIERFDNSIGAFPIGDVTGASFWIDQLQQARIDHPFTTEGITTNDSLVIPHNWAFLKHHHAIGTIEVISADKKEIFHRGNFVRKVSR